MDYLAVAACFKNESPYLREWIEFHRLVGVQKFFLYDNASTDSPESVLDPYVEGGIVQLAHTDMECCQTACYQNALELCRARWRWLAFIDLDEFLFCPDGRDLKAFLQEYEDYPCVGASWSCFGSSGHQRKPPGLVIENFTFRAVTTFEDNRHIKSICNPAQTLCTTLTPHNFLHFDTRSFPVDENRVPLLGPIRNPTQPHTVDRIRINHYATRSYEEWQVKRFKGRADVTRDHPEYVRKEDQFARNDRNEVHDTVIQRYLPQLKMRLGMSQELPES